MPRPTGFNWPRVPSPCCARAVSSFWTTRTGTPTRRVYCARLISSRSIFTTSAPRIIFAARLRCFCIGNFGRSRFRPGCRRRPSEERTSPRPINGICRPGRPEGGELTLTSLPACGVTRRVSSMAQIRSLGDLELRRDLAEYIPAQRIIDLRECVVVAGNRGQIGRPDERRIFVQNIVHAESQRDLVGQPYGARQIEVAVGRYARVGVRYAAVRDRTRRTRQVRIAAQAFDQHRRVEAPRERDIEPLPGRRPGRTKHMPPPEHRSTGSGGETAASRSVVAGTVVAGGAQRRDRLYLIRIEPRAREAGSHLPHRTHVHR